MNSVNLHESLSQIEGTSSADKKGTYITAKRKGLKISIITVTYNSAATIADTIKSVKNQNYQNVEHIIIDGASTDNTMEIISSFPHLVKGKNYFSEKDSGLYDAMNKGVKKATGEIIGILNSDDLFADNMVLSKVAARFENESTDTVYGDLNYVDPQNLNRIVRKWRSGDYKKSKFFYGWMPPHPSFFVRKRVYDSIGEGFKTSLRSAADYELMLRILFKHNYKAVYLPEVLVKMRAGGVSNSSFKNRIRANKEDRLAWKMNDLNPYFFTLYLKPLRKVFQFINKEQVKRLPLVQMFLG